MSCSSCRALPGGNPNQKKKKKKKKEKQTTPKFFIPKVTSDEKVASQNVPQSKIY